VTRAEFAAIVVRALGLPNVDHAANFADVEPQAWYAKEVAALRQFGIVSGYEDGPFRPYRKITRQEEMVMIA
jgi:S-layer homology domain.